MGSGIYENFELILEGRNSHELEPGDLILRNMNVKLSPYYHVGTYCRNQEVIEFTGNKLFFFFKGKCLYLSLLYWCSSVLHMFIYRHSVWSLSLSLSANVNGWLNWIVWAIGVSVSNVVSSVVKVSVKNFIRGKQYRVLRLKNAIPEDFSHRVQTAMDSTEEYNSKTNNCMHFALRLLG